MKIIKLFTSAVALCAGLFVVVFSLYSTNPDMKIVRMIRELLQPQNDK
ncbi:MAG: hypothetical protein IJR60_05995 [Eubacterium sp.]|nr:hypothetical protein [Eubacterium sp.]